MEKLSLEKAKEAGYCSITRGYNLKTEGWMLDNVISDMEGVDAVLVHGTEGVEVWRLKSSLKF